MKRGDQLLSKFLKGGLAPEERYELEKLALDDPLLAEAWEGLSAPYAKDNLAAISRLKKRLGASPIEAKVVPLYRKLWPYAVAASFLLVAAIGMLVRPQADADLGAIAAAEAPIQERSTEAVSMAADDMNENAEVVLSLDEEVSPSTMETSTNETSPPTQNTNTVSSTPATPSPSTSSIKSIEVAENTGGAMAKTTEEIPVKTRSAKKMPVATSSDMLAAQAKVIDEDEGVVMIALEEGELEDSQDIVMISTVGNNGITLANAEADLDQSEVAIYTNIADTTKEKEKRERTIRTAEMAASDVKGGSVSAAEAAKQIDMPSMPFEMDTEPTPANGIKAYTIEVNRYMELEVSEFFMRGLRRPYHAQVSFMVNEKGEPINIKTPENLGKDIGNEIKEAMKKSSVWINAPTETVITFRLVLATD